MTPEEQAAVDAYLSNGGKVTKVPTGQSAERMWWDGKSNLIRVESIYKRNIYGKGCLKNIAKAKKSRAEIRAEKIDARRAEVKRLHEKGKNKREIARLLDMNQSLVFEDLRALGIELDTMAFYAERGAKAQELLAAGMTQRAVAAELGMGVSRVAHWAKKAKEGKR